MTLAISLSLINLALYCIQQLGVTLGVGAETTLLVAYLQSMRDGVIDDKEQGFARAVRRVKDMGLFLMIVSGIGIVATQFLAGQLTDFLSIIVWFKWSLIGIVLFMTVAVRGYSLTAGLLQGLSAGTWYALFAVHILAPTASWLELGIFYALWLVGFCLCWSLLVFALRGKPGAVPRTQPVQTPKAQVQMKPAQNRPIGSVEPRPDFAKDSAQVPSKPAPTPPAPPASVPATTSISPIWLHVMPKTPEELAKHKERAA